MRMRTVVMTGQRRMRRGLWRKSGNDLAVFDDGHGVIGEAGDADDGFDGGGGVGDHSLGIS